MDDFLSTLFSRYDRVANIRTQWMLPHTALPICWNFAWLELLCGGPVNTVTITDSPSSGASKCSQLLRGRVSFLQWHNFGWIYHTAGEVPLPRLSRQYKWTWLEEDTSKLKTIKKLKLKIWWIASKGEYGKSWGRYIKIYYENLGIIKILLKTNKTQYLLGLVVLLEYWCISVRDGSQTN